MAHVCAQAAIKLLEQKDEVNILFPCAFSHIDFFKYFFSQPGVGLGTNERFVMDEYLGLPEGSPYLLSNFAQEQYLFQSAFKNAFAMNGAATDYQAECDRYAALLAKHPLDMACLGIGENGHLAYNEPAVADFNDPLQVKYIAVSQESIEQAVHDGAFPTLESVPRHAMTITIPRCLMFHILQAVVQASTKKRLYTHSE